MATFQAGDFPIDPNTVDGTELAARLNRMKGVLDNAVVTDAAGNITGDFTNTTANRMFFQTSILNGATYVASIPNGTASAAGFQAFASSTDPSNTSLFQTRVALDNNECAIYATRSGTGPYLPMTFYTGGSEAMRITTNRDIVMAQTLLVGATTGFVGSGQTKSGVYLINQDDISGRINFGKTTSGSRDGIQFNHNGTAIGGIAYSDTATVFNTASDYRLKENVQPMQNALSTVAQLKPVTYTWKTDGSTGQGFIAHELQAVVPDCVTGAKDAMQTVDDFDADGNKIGTKEVPQYQGIDTSFLVATLVAAIQELKAEVDALKAAHP